MKNIFLNCLKSSLVGLNMNPMLPTLAKEPIFNSSEWIYEVKWDGYRLVSHITPKGIVLKTKTSKIFSVDKFPLICKSLLLMPLNTVLDGEIIVLDEEGKPDFDLIRSHPKKGNAIYMVFDILKFKGKDLRQLPLIKRKEILQQHLTSTKIKNIVFVEHFEEKGKELFDLSLKHHFEGVIAKRKQSSYEEGSTKDWLKFKNKLYCDAVGMNRRFAKKNYI